MSPSNDGPVVYVVDDDDAVREAVDSLLRSVGYRVYGFASSEAFAAFQRIDAPACLVLDIRMQGRSGMDLQRELVEKQDDLPIVFITGHGDVPLSVRAIKGGAVDFLLKPFREQDLLDAVRMGIEKHVARREDARASGRLTDLYATLSPRERQISGLVAQGRINREIADELNLSEITVKVHRAKAMRKMDSDSMADFIKKIARLGALA